MPLPKNGIPDRWLDYKSVGKRIPGTRFIAFKVPLKQSLNNKVPSSDVFGPWELLASMEKEKEELGLIIDLTFTTRYYKPHDIPDSMSYLKILTAGHEIPSDSTILSFKRAVSRFLRDNADNDKLIGVHCTHGLNRTGYLVCRYLIDVDGMDPKEAVELFNSARGHAIERENYLTDLQTGPKRSNEGMEEPEKEPVRGQGGSKPPPPALFSHDRYHSGPPLHQRGMNHQQPWRPSRAPLLPPPPLLPPTPLLRPPGQPPLLPRPPGQPPPPLLPFPPYGSLLPPPSRCPWRPPPQQQHGAPWRRGGGPPYEDHRGGRAPPYPLDDRRWSSSRSSDQEWRPSGAGRPGEERRRGGGGGEERRRGQPPPPRATPPPLLPRYAPKAFRTSEPNGHSPTRSSDRPSSPRRKSHHHHSSRHTHRT